MALVIRSSDPASIAIIVTRADGSVRARSNAASIGRASSTGGVPRPRSASGPATEASPTITNSGAQTAFASGTLRRNNASSTHSTAVAVSTIALRSSAERRRGVEHERERAEVASTSAPRRRRTPPR